MMQQTPIRYADGTPVVLGDVVVISIPNGSARARVIMLGDTGEHLAIDCDFLDWVTRNKILEPSQVVVEWIDQNPFAHDDPRYAPVGNYMFTDIDPDVVRVSV